MKTLEGVLVADFTHAVAGPFCTLHLARLGADVVKVERPDGGDDFRSRIEQSGQPSTFIALNSGKRSLALDLKSDTGRAALKLLAQRADVLVENFRPGVAATLGLGWSDLSALNPRLIYVSISGFGQEGPLRDAPAIEWSVQAASGMTSAYVDPDGDRLRLGLSVLDPFTGYMAFAQVLAALRERDQTGLGKRLDVAMIDAATTLMWPQVVETLLSEPGRAKPRLGRRGTMARFRGSRSDIFVAALQQRWFEVLCEEIGALDLLVDERFRDPAARAAAPDELHAALSGRIAGQDADSLATRLNRRGVPAAVIRTLEEAIRGPHRTTRLAVDAAQLVAPALGQHTAEILAELGFETETAR